MNVNVGLECSGITRTCRPLLSSRYSEISPTVLTNVNPGTFGGCGAAFPIATIKSRTGNHSKRRAIIIGR
jgi:hypothetical protein